MCVVCVVGCACGRGASRKRGKRVCASVFRGCRFVAGAGGPGPVCGGTRRGRVLRASVAGLGAGGAGGSGGASGAPGGVPVCAGRPVPAASPAAGEGALTRRRCHRGAGEWRPAGTAVGVAEEARRGGGRRGVAAAAAEGGAEPAQRRREVAAAAAGPTRGALARCTGPRRSPRRGRPRWRGRGWRPATAGGRREGGAGSRAQGLRWGARRRGGRWPRRRTGPVDERGGRSGGALWGRGPGVARCHGFYGCHGPDPEVRGPSPAGVVGPWRAERAADLKQTRPSPAGSG